MRSLPAVCLLLALASSPALAACLDGSNGGALPMKVSFDSGDVVEVQERSADTLRYIHRPADGTPAMEMTTVDGIFTIRAARDGGAVVFDWTSGLPALSDLVVGASFREEATLTRPGAPPSAFVAEVSVTGEDQVTVGDCTFPVLLVKVINTDNGRNVGEVVKSLHLPSLISLKSEVTQGLKTRTTLAVTLE